MNFFSILANHFSLGRAKLWLMTMLIKLGIRFWLTNGNMSDTEFLVWFLCCSVGNS